MRGPDADTVERQGELDRADGRWRQVGVSARALYRYYPSKQALFTAVALDTQDRYLAAVDFDSIEGADPAARFAVGMEMLSDVALANRADVVLWQRESRHLDVTPRAELRRRIAEIAHRIGVLVAGVRGSSPDDPDVDFLAPAIFSLIVSPGHHTAPLPHAPVRAVLSRAALAVATVELEPCGDIGDAALPDIERASAARQRREQLLRAAIELFRRDGYPAVGIDAIAAHVGILGPSVYYHFESKSALLEAIFNRVEEWIALLSARTVQTAEGDNGAADALRAFGAGYAELAFDFPGLISVSITEAACLPEGSRLKNVRGDFVAEWALLVAAAEPGVDASVATWLAHAATAVVDDLARTPHLRTRRVLARVPAVLGAIHSSCR